ncbi:MAG: helix-turn-helix domain-containing protein [Desulfobacterales bacterium]
MTKGKHYLTTTEYAELKGMRVSDVTRMLRQGELKGVKQAGKWQIPMSQPPEPSSPARAVASTQPGTPADPHPPVPERGSYSVGAFAEMSYLTETGVLRFLKSGKLKGERGPDGQWRVDAGVLELPWIKKLIR